MAPESKRCSKCGEDKSVGEFNRNRSKADGRQSYCRPCSGVVGRAAQAANPDREAERNKRWRDQNAQRHRENARRWAKQNPERAAAKVKRYQERSPEKHRAHTALNNALSTGKLSKPGTCEDCRESTKSYELHGHHEDHSKPLEVRWLCRGCHNAAHRKEENKDV